MVLEKTNDPGKHVIFISAPGLRAVDETSDPQKTPTLCAIQNAGWVRPMRPTFPCVTSPVQAAMWTGTAANQHGIIANGFYFRDRNEVEFWVGRNDMVGGEQIWDQVKRAGLTSAVWHAQNIKDCAADYIITPAPIHEPDGSMKLWCYEKPEGLYTQLIAEFDHFPLMNYWGPMAGLPSSDWIAKAAVWLHEKHAPNFHFIYIPHLDYAAQKFGPDSEQAAQALVEFDGVVKRLMDGIDEPDVRWVIASEYAMTAVDSVVYPNRMLRDAGMLSVKLDGHGHELPDLAASPAFAMVDHQFAHVYVKKAADIERVAAVFKNDPNIDHVLVGEQRAEQFIDHERSGEIVLISKPNAWFAYYWWQHDEAAPKFAHTVDIHAKPGYDPVELFFNPATKSIPLDATLVKGSHGAPATLPQQEGAILCSGGPIEPVESYRDIDMQQLVLNLFGVSA